MAAIQDFLQQITDDNLRDRLRQEFDALMKKKKFGLVWEDHIPESTLLPEEPVRVNSMVARKKGETSSLYIVRSIVDGIARCVTLTDDTKEELIPVAELSVAVRFGEPVYPYLKPLDKVCRAENSSLWHTLIEADNYHALQLLDYLYRGRVDCIYIDPPYNTGARDWKYNNDYVDGSDAYRHSKWLSMMEKRLLLAKKLLNPKDSVLIVTIDEKEYLHLGCLLEKLFPEANMQMITSMINKKGSTRVGSFCRRDEYIYILFFGSSKVIRTNDDMIGITETQSSKAIWNSLLRRGAAGSSREENANLFYPFFIDRNGKIVEVGDPIPLGVARNTVVSPEGLRAGWPIRSDRSEGRWQVSAENARLMVKNGTMKAGRYVESTQGIAINYLKKGQLEDLKNGSLLRVGTDENGAGIFEYSIETSIHSEPGTMWVRDSHDASIYGSTLLRGIIYGRKFSFPKSLYAVHDALRFFVANKPNALIVDFFAGSGTTLHAVNLLNKEDNGNRRCIMVTNNEVSENEANQLSAKGLQPGDEEWDRWGIARYVTWPRTKCTIEGVDVNGTPIRGDYMTYLIEDKPMKRIIRQLSFLLPNENSSAEAKRQIVALLGKPGLSQKLVTDDCPYILTEDSSTSILFDDAKAAEWIEQLEDYSHVKEIYIITQNNKLFRQTKRKIEQLLGEYSERQPVVFPMADGFEANVEFFKLGFLNKDTIALGKALSEILPLLWMKAGCKGIRPLIASDEVHDMYIWEDNGFALLTNEYAFGDFVKQMTNQKKHIENVFIVTDSERAFMQMSARMPDFSVWQLYRNYLDNFRINVNRK